MKNTAKSTIYLVLGRGMIVVIQGLNFVVVARALGPAQFGVFASIVGVLSILYPLACCGAPLLLVQRFTEGYGFLHLWRFRRIITTTAPVVLAVALGAGFLALPSFGRETATFIVLLVLSEVVMFLGHDICFAMYQSTGLIYLSVPYSVGLPALRLGGNLLLIGLGWFSLNTFAMVQVAASGTVLYLFFRSAERNLRVHYAGGRQGLPTLRSDLSLGFQYAVGLLSVNATRDIDKALLPRLAGLASTGLYSSGFRIVDMVYLPILSLFNVIFPQFFEIGKHGTKGLWRFVLKTYRWTLGYASAASVLLFLAAPLVPYILGKEYGEVSAVVRWLSPIIFLKALYQPLADALTGLRRQALRVKIQLTVVGLNIVLNLLLIPVLGWLGAAIATLVSQVSLVIGIFAALRSLREDHFAPNGDTWPRRRSSPPG